MTKESDDVKKWVEWMNTPPPGWEVPNLMPVGPKVWKMFTDLKPDGEPMDPAKQAAT